MLKESRSTSMMVKKKKRKREGKVKERKLMESY